MLATFCVYGVQLHIAASRLQYQVVIFSPCVFMLLWILASFFLCESPRWLVLSHRNEEAANTLVRLRRLPLDHHWVQDELRSIQESIQLETEAHDPNDKSPSNIVSLAKETFTVPSNLRRVQQALILYAFPQFSGGNSITNYFIPILKIIGLTGNSSRNLFLNGMYTMTKFFFGLSASLFFIDALGRRNTLFFGITLQMISDIYLAAYIKVQNDSSPSEAAGEAALASIFIHSFGYTIGELTNRFNCARILTSSTKNRPTNSPIRLWRRAMAQPHSILWCCHNADLPLAISLLHDIRITIPSFTDG